MDVLPDEEGSDLDAFCVGDEEVDWSNVEQLAVRMQEVIDIESAIALYDELAGR